MLDRKIRALMPVIPRWERAFLFGLLFAALGTTSCERARARTHDAVYATRIVSLLPAATDVLLALGAADRIVGRTEFDTAAILSSVVSLGRSLGPSAEAILALQPDLIILPRFINNSARTEALLAQQRVAVLTPRLHTLSDLQALVDALGKHLGEPPAARALNDSIRDALARVKAGATIDSPSVLYLIWHEPPTVAGAGTYIDELIAIAGARNVMADLNKPWPQVSLEEVLRRAPDYLVLPVGTGHSDGIGWLSRQPGWRELTALRDGRVIEVDGDLFSQLGPHVVEAARMLASELRRRGGPR